MDVKVLDRSGQQLTAEQIGQLNIWNDTLSHICACVLERLRQASITSPESIARH